MMKTANGYKVVINCYVTEAVKYNTYNRETIVKVTKDYGTIFRDNKALFGAYDFQKDTYLRLAWDKKSEFMRN